MIKNSSSRVLRRSQRSVGRLLSRRVTTAAAAAVQQHEPVAYPSYPLPNTLESGKSDRRQAVKQAKPFSDFLTDNFNRQHDYLRISVTERCNLRCTYCMPEEGVPLSPQAQLLTTPEIFYISSLFVSQGVTKIRLTGGEPTVRPDIVPLMQQIGGLRSMGLRELALTTNGISLHRKLDKMVEAGLTGLNISLDTLDPFQFQILTRRKGFDTVMKSIDRVIEMNKMGAGVKLKINCVVMRGINDREIVPFVEMGREKDVEVRFIEYMPFDGNKWSKRKMLPYSEMLDLIREKYPGVRKVQGHFNDTSKTYEVPGFVGKLGFITSMTHNFCGSCNRLRITGDGNLKVCLFGNAEVSLRDIIRKDNNNQPIDQQAFEAIKEVEMNRKQGIVADGSTPRWSEREAELLSVIGMAVKRKKEKHAGMGELENMKNRPMILIADGTVSEEGRRTWSAGSSITKSSYRVPWSRIPTHMLSSSFLSPARARMYSTSPQESMQKPTSPKDQSRKEEDSDNQVSTASQGGITSTFQSLSSLFQSRSEESSSTSGEPAQLSQNKEGVSRSGPVLPPSRSFEKGTSDWASHGVHGAPQTETLGTHFYMKSPTARERPVKDIPGAQPRRERRNAFVDAQRASRRERKQQTKEEEVATAPGRSDVKQHHHHHQPPPPWGLPTTIRTLPSAEAISDSQTKISSDWFGGKGQPSAATSQDTFSAPQAKTSPGLTHVTSSGEAHMVDVTAKSSSNRVAVACGHVIFSTAQTSQLITENSNKKGDVLGVARIAGIMAAKRCSDLIPLCHPISISKVTVDVTMLQPGERIPATRDLRAPSGGAFVEARVHCYGPTGVEMEALTAVSGAALTVYDMCKAVDRSMEIGGAKVMLKAGGKSGDWTDDLWADLQSWRKAKSRS